MSNITTNSFVNKSQVPSKHIIANTAFQVEERTN